MMKASRRSHHKSRTGCATCRRRRVKCDETRPTCQRCAQARLACNYADGPASLPWHMQPSSAHQRDNAEDEEPAFATELELMHHFTAWTYKTCDRGVMSARLWQEELPVLSTKHSHLLFALLSFTSLHIAYLRPDAKERYLSIALRYRERALQVLSRVLGRLSDESISAQSEDPDACFWSASLVGLIELALYNINRTREKNAKSVVLELARLWRGVGSVGEMCLRVTGVDIMRKYAVRVPRGNSDVSLVLNDEFGDYLAVLREQDASDCSNQHPLSNAYIDAADRLKAIWSAWKVDNSLTGILSWIPGLATDVLDGLDHGNESVNLLFVLYGVCAHQIKEVWYMQDLGAQLIQELAPLIDSADEKKRGLVKWAQEQICLEK